MNQGSYYGQPDLGDLVVYGQLGGEMPQVFCSTCCLNVGLLFHTPMYQEMWMLPHHVENV